MKNRFNEKLLFIDTETGGTDSSKHSLLQIGLVAWDISQGIIDQEEIFIKHNEYIMTNEAKKINKFELTQHELSAVEPDQALKMFIEFCRKNFPSDYKIIIAGHNVQFDINFIKQFFLQNNRSFSNLFSHRSIDTYSIVQFLNISGLMDVDIASSSKVFQQLDIKVEKRHDALQDAIATVKLFEKLIHLVK